MTKKKTEPIDMSAAAIAARLEDVRSLYRLTMSLAEAQIVGPALAPNVRR